MAAPWLLLFCVGGLMKSAGMFAIIALLLFSHMTFAGKLTSTPTTVRVLRPGSMEPLTQFTLTGLLTGEQSFMVGLGFAKGDVFPGNISLDISNYQIDVLRTWNDGSVKHAAISGRISLAQGSLKTVIVSRGIPTASAPSLELTDMRSASNKTGLAPSNLSAIVAQTPLRVFLKGPELIEAHFKDPVSNSRTWYQVRYFRRGLWNVRAVNGNGTVNKSVLVFGYDAGAHTGGSTEYFSGTSDNQNAFPAIKHDLSYLRMSKLVPNYWKRPTSTAGLGGEFPLLGMDSGGYHDHIGLLPNWEAIYLTTGQEKSWKHLLAQAKVYARYPVFFRDILTSNVFKPSDFSDSNRLGTYSITSSDSHWEIAHHPAPPYLAYLLSADYLFYDTLLNVGATLYLTHSGGGGYDRNVSDQVRGMAWSIRTLSLLSGIYPQSDSVGADYQKWLAKLVTNYLMITQQTNFPQLGYFYEYGANGVLPYGNGEAATWMQNFVAASFGFGSDVEPLTDMTNFIALRNFTYKGPVGLLGPGGSNAFCFRYASTYTIDIHDGVEIGNLNPMTWFKTWAEPRPNGYTIDQWAAVRSDCATGSSLLGSSSGSPAGGTTGYWGNLLPAIAYAVDHNAPGAAEAFNRIRSASNFNSLSNAGFEETPVWGVVPRSFVLP